MLTTLAATVLLAASATTESMLPIQVTATRLPETVDTVPADITVLDGNDLRARGVRDLAGALAFVAGTEAPLGGDTGPAGAVPSFWGLHEFDAFLLVVDGVPAGGAFNPSVATLDLTDVQRIEVMQGAAPVTYGATSFVGVIQVIHYPAGESSESVRVQAKSRGGAAGSLATTLPTVGTLRSSLVLDADHDVLTGRNQGTDRGHLLYRGAMAAVAGHELTLDAEYTGQTQHPTSPVVATATGLTSVTPLDANLGPGGAGIIAHTARFSLGDRVALARGEWQTHLSYTDTTIHDVRGFARPELALGDDGANADGFDQDRSIKDLWFDSFVALPLSPTTRLTTGVDLLYGQGTQTSRNFAYVADLSGATAADDYRTYHVDEVNTLDDRRVFAGAYAQLEFSPSPRYSLLAGVRLNHTHETQSAGHVDTIDATQSYSGDDARTTTRLGGMLGATVRLWGTADDGGQFWINYRNTFKPAAIDFGPDVNLSILKPETAAGLEAGLRGRHGPLEWSVEAFTLDFEHLVVHSIDANGAPILANAGTEHFHGLDAEARWHPSEAWSVGARIAHHQSHFGPTVEAEGGDLANLAGHSLELSPRLLAGLDLRYAPTESFGFTVGANHVGSRFLDRANTIETPSYTTIDATLSVPVLRGSVQLVGRNLTDRRDPVTASEFGEASYYRLNARTFALEVVWPLGR